MEKSRLKSSLFFKNIVPNPTCDLCECEIEDIIHVLRDCVEARKVWDHFNAKHELLVGTKDEWCKSNMLSRDPIFNLSWGEVFPFICYELWLARNMKVFKGIPYPNPIAFARKISFSVWEFMFSKIVHRKLATNAHPALDISHDRTFIVNVDASMTNHSKPSCVAACLRNSRGD